MTKTETNNISNNKAIKNELQDKAGRLIRIYFAMLSVGFLLSWMQLLLLNPLKDDEKEMVRS